MESDATSSGSDCDVVRSLNSVQTSQKQNKRAKISPILSVTSKNRAPQSVNEDFNADGDILFCRVCPKAVDHSMQSTMNCHKASDVHISNRKKLVSK